MQLVRWRHVSLVFQGAMNSLDPVQRIERPDRRGDPAARARGVAASVRRADRRAAGDGRADRRRRARATAPALRRPAPAGDDRPGARLPAVAGDRRRADDRARRRHAGAGAAAARAPARGARPGADPDLPRPRGAGRDLRPDRGHVRGADRRERARSTPVFDAPQHPVHEAAARLAAGDRRRARAGDADPGRSRPTRATLPQGCRFRPRCPYAQERCLRGPGAARGRRPGTSAACHFAPWKSWPEVEAPAAAAEARRMTEALMEVARPRRPLQRATQGRAGARRRLARVAARRDPRRRRRVRAAASRRSRARCSAWSSRAAGSVALDGDGVDGKADTARAAAPRADDLPGPVPDAESRASACAAIVAEPLRVQGVAAGRARRAGAPGAGRRRSRSRALPRAATRTSSPAASASGWRSRRRWCSSPTG